MKKSIKLTLTVALFFLAIAGIRVLWIMNVSPKVNLGETEAGKMDLSSFASEEALYPLAGEWLFFPEEHLTTEEVKNNVHKGHIEHYPQGWLDYSATKDFNYGTFYTQVTLHESLLQKSLSMHVPNARLASSLYVDGELLGSSGNPASSLATFEASMSPYVVHFFTEKNTLDIVLHVSNDGMTPPVPDTPIVLGTTDAIQGNQVFSTISKLVVVTVFSFILLFALFLFIYFKTNERKTMFYLALLATFSIVTILLDYDQVILLDLPITYDVKSKIYRLAYVCNALFAFYFFKHFLAQYKTPSWFSYYPYVAVSYGLFLVVAPLTLIDDYSLFLAVVLFPPIIYYIIKLFNALRDDATDAVLLFLMGIAMLNNLIWSIYKNYAGMLTFEYYPLDALIALVLFMLYWLRKYLRHTEEIEALTDELLEKDREKDDFLAQTSHELRNPLHSMINIAQLVAENPKNKLEKADEAGMDLLLSVGKRMSLLVDDLLDLSLMSEKRLRLHQSPVYIQTVVTTVIEMVDYLREPKKITIHNDIAADFPPIYADESRVIQLVLNLIHNAIKFTDEGEIVITARVVDDEAVIEISDTGRGMDASYVNEVFEPFFKSDDVDGIGLGLQVTKELVELHGGNITIDSVLHKGTMVTFTLPLVTEFTAVTERQVKAIADTAVVTSEKYIVATVQDEAGRLDGAPSESEMPGEIETSDETGVPNASKTDSENETKKRDESQAKILLVDDDHVNVNVMAKVLQADGYIVTTVLSGEAALEKIQTKHFDLIISDVMMPHMSGYELVKEIRKQYNLSELPIVLLTARGKMDDLNTGFQAGANDYLVKPVDAQELKARVKALTDLQVAVKDQLRLEAAWLRAQMNPHFLYNTINSIMMMARANPERMQYLLEKFVYFLRTSYDFQSKQSLVTLQDELKLIDAYVAIEKERFGDRLQIVWGIDESLHLRIPPLSLQTLVENALKHGVLNRIEGGTVTLQSIEEEEHIDLIVQDDGVGMSQQLIEKIYRHEMKQGDGIGLINTDKRLRRWLQTSLTIESEPNEGTTITIRIKKVGPGQKGERK